MRTALVLLFLLALAAVPGSLLPQRPLNPPKVKAYLASHGAWGRFLDRIGMFDVFGSVWFTAIYLLLFVSLIGCLVPRIRVYARALRAKPLKAPRNLSRLPESGELVSQLTPEEAAARVSAVLRPRWRATTRTEEPGVVAVSAEKGYSREAGNLLFHIMLLIALVLIAAGRLTHYQGQVLTTEGTGFCNTAISYDSWTAGSSVNTANLAKFCVDELNSFTVNYRPDGTAAQFKARVTYSEGLDGPAKHDTITVNHPLRIEGDRIYLLNHGFSPTVTIKRPGQPAWTSTAPFLPQDAFLTSEGVFQYQGPGTGHDIGIEGLFAPDPIDQGNGVITSASPQAKDPVLAMIVYEGDLGLGQGTPHSVYSLKQSQKDSGALKKVAMKNLTAGQSLTLSDGTVITFDGYKQWASLQVSHDPTQLWLLIAAVLMVAGLLGSLSVRRRRLWVRVRTDFETGRSLITAGGLARSDTGNFTAEFETIFERLRDAVGSAAVPAGTAAVGAGKD